jgi:mRNA-capping enzyme
MTHLGPPPRWLRCPRKGALIADKFFPFKVPLKQEYDDQIAEEHIFHPEMVFDFAKALGKKKKIGLWIDLTKTERYYDKVCQMSKYYSIVTILIIKFRKLWTKTALLF